MSFPWSAASTFKGRARTRVCVRAGGVGDRGSRAGGFTAVVAAVAEATQLETAEEGQPVHRRSGQVRWEGRGPPQDLPPGAAACAGESAVGVTWGGEGARAPSLGTGLLGLEDALELGVGRRRNWTAVGRRRRTRGVPPGFGGGSARRKQVVAGRGRSPQWPSPQARRGFTTLGGATGCWLCAFFSGPRGCQKPAALPPPVRPGQGRGRGTRKV